MMPYFLILLPIAAGTVLSLFRGRLLRWPVLIFQTGMVVVTFLQFLDVTQHGSYQMALGGWAPPVGIALGLDALSASFQLLTCFLFLLCFILGLSEPFADNLFTFLFMTLQALILALFTARDLFTLSLLFEVATILISILIMYKKDSRAIYDGLTYLLLNIAGMTFFLFGVAIVYKRFGLLDMKGVAQAVAAAPPEMAVLPFAFLFTGVLLKSAQAPVFFWLPKAHATPSAPSEVSAILSGLYINGGLYLFIRLRDVFSQAIALDSVFLAIGLLTALTGIIAALLQHDIKGILAYSTISQAGLMVTGLSMGTEDAWWGAIMHIFNHSLYKSLLFLTAGTIIRVSGTRDIRKIRGIGSSMPAIAIASLLGVLGITGAPFLNGSISKFYLQRGAQGWFVQAALLLVNLGTLTVFAKYAEIFSGPRVKKHVIPVAEQATMLILGGMCLLGGLFGQALANRIFSLSLVWDWKAYLEKTLLFFASLLLSLLLWHLMLKHRKPFRTGYALEPTFNAMALLLVLLFGLLLVFGTLSAGV